VETHQPRGGETAAFRELFDRYYAPLCRFAAYWLRDRTSAEEIVLDTFTHIWQHAAELHILTSVRAYLFRAVRNRALNRLRDERPAGISIEGPEPLFTNPEALQLEADEMMMLVAEAVSQLPDRCREVFRMSRFEGLKNREIAARLGISETAVEKHLARAVGRLGEHLRRSCSFELSVAVLSCLLANYL